MNLLLRQQSVIAITFCFTSGEKTRILDPSLPIKGARPLIIDDLDEDSDGNIYWSDASSAFDLLEGVMEAFVGPTGR